MHPRIRLNHAWRARHRSVDDYGKALRAGLSREAIDHLAAVCRKTDAELTEAMRPFMETQETT